MANRFYSPDQQFISNSGVPYAGGFLYFYATGTSTPLNTYSDSGLTIANTNPIVLDSNGQAGSVFLQNLAYKVVLADSSNVQIWTQDPVWSSDYSTFAQFQPFNGNPNGFVAGTAGTVGALPGTSAVWDYVDDILYVCTTTGNAATAVWTAINASAATPATPQPQGYLTLSSDASNPVLTADAVSSTSVFYTPYIGSLVPVYNGSSFITTSFTQLTLALSASQALNTLYDVFVFSNSGVLTLVAGPSWSSSTAGSGSRGTGGGTTQLQRLNGLWVNAVQISGKNGATTYTISANTATYLGTIFIDGTAGQISCYRSWGQSRKWGVWNAYNRVPIYVMEGDSTATWTYASATVRQSNASVNNFVTTLCGLPEEEIVCRTTQNIFSTYSNGQGVGYRAGIGLNVTNAISGTSGVVGASLSATGASANFNGTSVGEFVVPPGIGINTINFVEAVPTNSATTITLSGGQSNMLLSTYWRG